MNSASPTTNKKKKPLGKLSSLSAGVALGAGMLLLGTGCATTGQCASCGACATGFPILAAPILVDGAIILIGKAKSKIEKADH